MIDYYGAKKSIFFYTPARAGAGYFAKNAHIPHVKSLAITTRRHCEAATAVVPIQLQPQTAFPCPLNLAP